MSERAEYGDVPDAEIPLEEEERLFEEGFDAALAALLRDLASGAYRRHIHDLALQRLREGYVLYGDQAYRWGAPCRQANIDEEVADAIVYLTTGPT
jgi:hypothetical protein